MMHVCLVQVLQQGHQERLDLTQEESCNWMMFVRPAQTSQESNLAAYQLQDHIYYISTKVEGSLIVFFFFLALIVSFSVYLVFVCCLRNLLRLVLMLKVGKILYAKVNAASASCIFSKNGLHVEFF